MKEEGTAHQPFPALPVLPAFPVFPVTEGLTRAPVTPQLRLPGGHRSYGGLAASLVFHALLLAILVGHGERLWSRTLVPGDSTFTSGGSLAGRGGGNRVAYIVLPSIPKPPKIPAATVPVPIPTLQLVQQPAPVPVEETPPPAEPVDTAAAAVPQGPGTVVAKVGSNPGTGAGTGTGMTQGAGNGDVSGPGTGTGPGGQGAKVRPPEPRVIAPPLDTPPKELRGASLSVTFWVRVDGRVERYEVLPEIKDREYAKKFDEAIRAFRFTPARAPDGSRVPGTATISFTLQGKSSS